MCLKAQRAALCEGLAVLSCPMPGSSLRVLLSRCHRPLYVHFCPLIASINQRCFESRILLEEPKFFMRPEGPGDVRCQCESPQKPS